MSFIPDTLDKVDAKYCTALMGRFETLGINKSVATSALKSMVDRDAIPTQQPIMATPSLFPTMKAHTSERSASLAPGLS